MQPAERRFADRLEPHLGKLSFPWGYGVVFTNLTQKHIQTLDIDQIIDERLILNKDDLLPSVETEDFQTKLWNMFNYQLGESYRNPRSTAYAGTCGRRCG